MDYHIISSPIGKIGMTLENNKLIALGLAAKTCKLSPPESSMGKHIVNELSKYFQNCNHRFSVDFNLHGTPFQKRVWKALQRIPCGQAVTYGALAKQLNTHPRAIGQACKTNPIFIIIPCHRVIAANHLGGYAGERAGAVWEIKKWLLKHEAARNQTDEIYNQSGRSMFSRCGNSRG